MGVSNLKVGLEQKYSTWLGEKKQVDKEIAEILGAYTKLAAKQLRSDRLAKLIDASQTILSEIAPNMDLTKVKPKMPRQWSRTFETGSITRWSYDVLRPATEPLTSRAIALEIAKGQGVDPDDKATIERIRVAVDAHLRKKVGIMVDKIGDYPCYWKMIDFDDRPDPMPTKP